MKKNYDVAVVGAGTAGILFAQKMAAQGYQVAVFDQLSQERQGERLGVFHTDTEHFAPYGVPVPQPGDEDYVSHFDFTITKSAFNNYPKHVAYPFLVLRFQPFLKRLRSWAAETGNVEFIFGAAFEDFTRDDAGNINGAVFEVNGERQEFSVRLVADCSGIPSVARRKLQGSRVETFEITPRDMLYVVLHYVRLKHPGQPFPENVKIREQYPEGRIHFPTNYAQHKAWFGSTEDPDGFLIGTGANLSFDFAMKCHERFLSYVEVPPYEEYEGYGPQGRWERGATPYHRAPYALADSGFICLGDSACMTKPFNGEGISAAWVAVKLAAEVCGKAMQNGAYPSEQALWEFNRRYAQTQGADFANLRAVLVNAVDCTDHENEYEFKKGIVFTDKLITLTNRTFSADMPAGESLALVGKMIIGTLTGNISLASLRNMIRGVLCGGALKAHYKKYPASPVGFDKWRAKADKLWEKAGNMADVVEKLEARREMQ